MAPQISDVWHPSGESTMLKTIFYTCIFLVICAACIYFFDQRSYLAAVALLIIAVSTLFGSRIRRFAETVDTVMKYSNLDRNCNCAIEMNIEIEPLLQHKAVSDLFDRMHSKGMIKDNLDKTQWLALLLENYKQKHQSAKGIETLTFKIKNNLLWKNGTVDFRDIIYHEVVIPHDIGVEIPEFTLNPDIHYALYVRLLIVNGIIKLQVGNFSKDLSPEVLKQGLGVYKTYETVTSFPLLYFSYRHRIPESYLNLSMYATDSYWKSKTQKKIDFTVDWKNVVTDVADYKYLCSVADEYVENRKRWDKITMRFDQTREEWLKRENFSNLLKIQEDYQQHEYIDLHDHPIYYSNQYLSVFAANQNESKERWQKYLYPDYYVERP